MRHIGSLNDKSQAEKIVAFLISKDISALAEIEDDGFEIWVKEEDQLEDAIREFDTFVENPDDPIYADAIQAAREIQAAEKRKLQQARKNVVSMQQQWNRPALQRAPLTVVMIILSVMIFFFSGMGEDFDNKLFRGLLAMSITAEEGNQLAAQHGIESPEMEFASIAHGEVWRLFSPMFIHFGLAHIAFNMIWLFILGQQVEAKFGWWKYLAIILVISLTSNVLQILPPDSWDGSTAGTLSGSGGWIIACGGMSGVVYGLFGLVWIRSRLDPNGGFAVSTFAVVMVVGWMFLCMMPNSYEMLGFRTANWAHAVGLIVGLTIGYWTLWWEFKRRQMKKNQKKPSTDV